MKKILFCCGILFLFAGTGYCERTQLDSLLEQAVACSTPSLANIGPCRMIGIDLAILGRENPEKLAAGLNTVNRGKLTMVLTAFQYIGDPDTLDIKYFATFAHGNSVAGEDLLLLFIHVLSGIYSDKSMAALKDSSSVFDSEQLEIEICVGMAAQGSMQIAYPFRFHSSTNTFVRASMIRAHALMGDEAVVRPMLKSAREEGVPGLEGIEQDLAFGLFLSKKYPEQPEAPQNLKEIKRRIANGQYDNPTRGNPKAIEKFKLEYAYELAVKTQNSEEWDWAFGFLSSHPLNPKYGKRLRDLAAKAVSEEHRRQAGELIAFFDKRTKEIEEQEAVARAERKKRTPEMVMEQRVTDLMEQVVSCSSPIVTTACLPAIGELTALGNKALPYIVNKGLYHPREQVRSVAIEVMGRIGDPSSIDALGEVALKSGSIDLRRDAVMALAGIADERSLVVLRKSLTDADEGIRLYAADGLAILGDTSGEDVVMRSTGTTDKFIRYTVVNCLVHIGNERSQQVLEAYRKDKLLDGDMERDYFALKITKARNAVDPGHKMTPLQVRNFNLQYKYETALGGQGREAILAAGDIAVAAMKNPEAENMLRKLAYSSNFEVAEIAGGTLPILKEWRRTNKEKLDELGR